MLATDSLGGLFHRAGTWADMDAWHEQVARAPSHRHRSCVVDAAGYAPFWVLTRHADVFAVSRDNDAAGRTPPRSVLGPGRRLGASWSPSGMPSRRRSSSSTATSTAATGRSPTTGSSRRRCGTRQPRIDEIADHFVERMRELGGECDFAKDIAQPYTLRVIMDIYGVPEEDEPLMIELTQGIFGAADPEFLGDADDPQASG